jgi:hypothetical protein
MHPDVGNVVSNYQYDGNLKTAPDRSAMESTLSPFIAAESRAIWYVLDDEGVDLASIRAARGLGNKSWVRGVTLNVLQKLFSDTNVRASDGLFISPFTAQSQVIGKLLAGWEMTTFSHVRDKAGRSRGSLRSVHAG